MRRFILRSVSRIDCRKAGSSPVALSEVGLFRRKVSSVFDTLQNVELDFDEFLPALYLVGNLLRLVNEAVDALELEILLAQ